MPWAIARWSSNDRNAKPESWGRRRRGCSIRSESLPAQRFWRSVARAVGLADGSFDLVTSRLVLVNIPEPERMVATAVALARPGGVVAFHELWDLYPTVSAKN